MKRKKIEDAQQCVRNLHYMLEQIPDRRAEDALALTKSIVALLAWMELEERAKERGEK